MWSEVAVLRRSDEGRRAARRSRASRLGKTWTLLRRRLISAGWPVRWGCGTHAPRARSGRAKTARPRDAAPEPVGEAVGVPTAGGDEAAEFLLRGPEQQGIPDLAALGADPLADGDVGGVVNGVLREVELGVLPDGAGRTARRAAFSPAWSSLTTKRMPRMPRSIRSSRRLANEFLLRRIGGDAEHAPSPVRSDADGGEQGGIADGCRRRAASRSGCRGRDSGISSQWPAARGSESLSSRAAARLTWSTTGPPGRTRPSPWRHRGWRRLARTSGDRQHHRARGSVPALSDLRQ